MCGGSSCYQTNFSSPILLGMCEVIAENFKHFLTAQKHIAKDPYQTLFWQCLSPVHLKKVHFPPSFFLQQNASNEFNEF